MAEKRQAAEKEVEQLRRAVEESVTLARVEEDEEPGRETLVQPECPDADIDIEELTDACRKPSEDWIDCMATIGSMQKEEWTNL